MKRNVINSKLSSLFSIMPLILFLAACPSQKTTEKPSMLEEIVLLAALTPRCQTVTSIQNDSLLTASGAIIGSCDLMFSYGICVDYDAHWLDAQANTDCSSYGTYNTGVACSQTSRLATAVYKGLGFGGAAPSPSVIIGVHYYAPTWSTADAQSTSDQLADYSCTYSEP